MTKILLVGGHGAGAAYNRGGVCYNEGDNNYFQTVALKEAFDQYEGIQAVLGRKTLYENPSLGERAAMSKGYDLAIMWHSNAATPTVRGTEVFDSVERPNKALASKICSAISTLFGHNNRGVKYKRNSKGTNWYGELRNHGAKSAMIVEAGFHTNHLDCRFAKDNHKKIAEEVAKVVANHYGHKKKSTAKPTTPSNWAKDAWKWAVDTGLMDGTNPRDPLTREQFAVVLHRMSKNK